jgi:hypothetical protein
VRESTVKFDTMAFCVHLPSVLSQSPPNVYAPIAGGRSIVG